MYVCVCVCVCVCLCEQVCIIHDDVHVYTCTCDVMYIVHACIFIHVHVHMCVLFSQIPIPRQSSFRMQLKDLFVPLYNYTMYIMLANLVVSVAMDTNLGVIRTG